MYESSRAESCVTQRAGQQPDDRIHDHHGRQLTAAQHIVSDGPFLVHLAFEQALVDPLVAPGDAGSSPDPAAISPMAAWSSGRPWGER